MVFLQNCRSGTFFFLLRTALPVDVVSVMHIHALHGFQAVLKVE